MTHLRHSNFVTRHCWRQVGLFLLLITFAHAAQQERQASDPVHVVVVATTDLHGRFESREEPVGGPNTEKVRWGGIDLLAGYLENLRAANDGRVVLLDAGDMWQGTLASNLSEGEVVVRAYSAVGYTAAAIGNHEFDYGPVGAVSVARNRRDDPLGALKRNAARAKFPLLAANIREKASGQRPPWARPFVLVSTGGVKIGIIGLITTDTPTSTFPVNVASLAFIDPVVATIQAFTEVRSLGAAAFVVVAHLGGNCRDLSDPQSLGSCAPEQESFRLARALPAGTVDVIFGGHTHAEVRHFVNGIAIAQAAPYGRAFATVDLWIDRKKGRVIAERTVIRPHTMICEKVFVGTESCDPQAVGGRSVALVPRLFENRTVTRDQELGRLFTPFLRKVAAKQAEQLGITLAAPFVRGPRGEESMLGNLVADALRDSVSGADFALMNPGGLRADLRGPQLTYGEVFEALPFDNLLATVKVSARELRDMLSISLQDGRLLQVSGLKVVIDRAAASSPRSVRQDQIVAVTRSDGSALDPAALLTVALPDFLASGGDGLVAVTSKLPADRIHIFYDRPPFREEVIEVLKKRAGAGPLQPAREGRIIIRTGSE